MGSALHQGGEPLVGGRTLAKASAEAEASQAFRPFRNGDFRLALDQEFQRSYRFETLSNVFHDVKLFFRNIVARENAEVGNADLPMVSRTGKLS